SLCNNCIGLMSFNTYTSDKLIRKWKLLSHVQGDKVNMGYFPVKSAVSRPICKGGDTNWKKILAKSVSHGWSPETLHDVVSMMAVSLLSFKGHFCPSYTPN